MIWQNYGMRNNHRGNKIMAFKYHKGEKTRVLNNSIMNDGTAM